MTTPYAPADLLSRVILPALAALAVDPPENIGKVSTLLLRTCKQESNLGEFRKQMDGGPALGIWQMEPATATDIWTSYLYFRLTIQARIVLALANGDRIKDLAFNDRYACMMARLQYLRSPLEIPDASDVEGQAALYLRVYNAGGKATVAEFCANAQAVADQMTA